MHEFSDAVPDPGGLETAIDKELAVEVHDLSARQLGERVLWLRTQHDRLSMGLAAAEAEFERSRAYVKLDPSCTSAAQWLADQASIPVKVARASFRLARRLTLLPLVVQAVTAGVITAWHAERLAGACINVVRGRWMADSQEDFIAFAGSLTGREFVSALDHWTEVNFGEEIAARAAAADEARSFHISRTIGGSLVTNGALHPVYGTEVQTCLARIDRELFAVDWERAKATHGDDTRVEHLARTASQRRHDALVLMARRAEAAQPNARARRPLVSVVVDFDTLHGRVCELEDGTHLAVDSVIEMLSAAEFERAVAGPDDRVAVSERARLFTGAERRAVELRDRFCTERSCEATVEECDVDHIRPVSDGGRTRQDNGRLRCPSHHEGRRKDPADRPLPWECVDESEWDGLQPDAPLDVGEGLAAFGDAPVDPEPPPEATG